MNAVEIQHDRTLAIDPDAVTSTPIRVGNGTNFGYAMSVLAFVLFAFVSIIGVTYVFVTLSTFADQVSAFSVQAMGVASQAGIHIPTQLRTVFPNWNPSTAVQGINTNSVSGQFVLLSGLATQAQALAEEATATESTVIAQIATVEAYIPKSTSPPPPFGLTFGGVWLLDGSSALELVLRTLDKTNNSFVDHTLISQHSSDVQLQVVYSPNGLFSLYGMVLSRSGAPPVYSTKGGGQRGLLFDENTVLNYPKKPYTAVE